MNRLPPLLLLTLACLPAEACRFGPTARQNVSFEKHQLANVFYSEGVAAGDLNRDGRPDIVAGDVWFEAPTWIRHEIEPPRTFDPQTEYSHTFLNFTLDVNLDGWIDVIRIGSPGEAVLWLANPGRENGPWRRHVVLESVGNESPRQADVDADGRLDLVLGDHQAQHLIWLRAPTRKGDTLWTRHDISGPDPRGSDRYAHGLGLGDVNRDTRVDVVITHGWWEAPEQPLQAERWPFHEADLGEDAAQMYVDDFDGDGDRDVLSSSAHRFGIWWHEQLGEGRWTTHLIDESFSQSHALAIEDIDGDGDPDFVTGKRYLAHNGNDPGSSDPAILVWYEFQLTPDGPVWTPHVIDDDSGVGEHLVVDDITGDGLPDILVSNKKGVFFFEQR